MDVQSNGLREILDSSRRVAVFTGAGISTESGIPDFRSADGLWTKIKPIDYDEFISSQEARHRSWQLKLEMEAKWSDARPNRGHRAVAELVKRGKCHGVITQNVDGLHQMSGVDDDKVIELHGNNTYARCIDCGTRHELEPIMAAFQCDGRLPVCCRCGGIVKSATISFGEAMPEAAMGRAQAVTLKADLFLVLGSSLVVYPAAGFPKLAAEMGTRVVIINREPTAMDIYAELVIHGEIGEILGAAVGIE